MVLPTLQQDAPTRRLHALMRPRETTWPLFRATWDGLVARFGDDEIACWVAGMLRLVDVNAGPSCFVAFWSLCATHPADDGIAPLIAAADAGAEICRHAGAPAATAAIAAAPTARRLLGLPAMPRWWQIMENLAREAPESVGTVAKHLIEILTANDVDDFGHFVAAGLKAAAGSKQRRLNFFALQDELARRLIERPAAGVGFAETEAATKAFVTSLWGVPPLLRNLPTDLGQTQQRRVSLAAPLIRMPAFYRGVEGDAARALYKAAAAHAQAHLLFGGPRFPVGTLKPLQLALVTLIEDARVETLAMRQLPGLRRLWAPYHVAQPNGAATAPMLLARLARALFDPAHPDDDGFVGKGRAMFQAAQSRIADPTLSREIGMLLGNDLGQMRVQFNARTYVVEPLYRDDGLGLWDFGDSAPTSKETLELTVSAARTEPTEAPDSRDAPADPNAADDAIARARPVAADPRGTVVARYPEWDQAYGIERPDWTTVREVAARRGDPRTIEHALDQAQMLRNRIAQLVRGVRVGRPVRLKRQFDGHDFDIDAMIDAGISLRMKRDAEPRIFRASAPQHRDLSVLLLIDISQSTRDRLASGASILDVERLAVAVLAEAMDALGDPFCLLAFASNGRDDVQVTAVKSFAEPYRADCIGRLAGLSSGLSTRLGTALRHAGASIAPARTLRKLVIVLTDGEPSDIDTAQTDLVEDARRAAAGLRRRGIDSFGVVLDPGGITAASRIFGRGNTMLVPRVEDLPGQLSGLYFRLARR
ncbi:MAG: VWA domain-containing protein [Rhodopseudomonas sp.]|nr:VWA domain-containing protein [Rhodopseudomonas sp.]